MTVLLDNTVLANFSAVRRPELVRLAFVEEVVTTEQVYSEMQEGARRGKIPLCDWDWLPVMTLKPVEEELFNQLAQHLGWGEASCLAIAFHRGSKVATDDRDARRQARLMNLSLTGSVGILAILVKRGYITIDVGNQLLRQMIAAGYRSPVPTLEPVLQAGGSG